MRVVKELTKKQQEIYNDLLMIAEQDGIDIDVSVSEFFCYNINKASKRLDIDVRILEAELNELCSLYFEAGLEFSIRIEKEETKPAYDCYKSKLVSLISVSYLFIDGEEEPSETQYILILINDRKIVDELY